MRLQRGGFRIWRLCLQKYLAVLVSMSPQTKLNIKDLLKHNAIAVVLQDDRQSYSCYAHRNPEGLNTDANDSENNIAIDANEEMHLLVVVPS